MGSPSEQGSDPDLKILVTWLGGGSPSSEAELFSASPAASITGLIRIVLPMILE